MNLTTYNVATPHGAFSANWDEDDEIPVQYEGDPDAIAYFQAYLDLNAVSARGGALVRFETLEPDDLYGFCQSDKYGIAVMPTVDDLLEPEDEEAEMQAIYDSVSNADTFTLIGEGAQILSGLDENADSFFADIARLREIIQALGEDAPKPVIVTPDPTPEPAPEGAQPAPTVNMENYIKIAADSIAALRRVDVYRVLYALAADNIDGVTRAALAQWIIANRPDLAAEVTTVMDEEWPGELNVTAVDPVLPVDQPLPEGGAVVPPADGEAVRVNDERTADLAYLGDVTKANVDMQADEVPERIEAIIGKYSGDADVEAGAREAIAAYTDYWAKAIGAS
ncbi:hypothetical protein PQR05_29415 [Paraburkholderia sediminicola]|uniref:hypothetical protein n=1 Tax=Paraburkholderia sediminicola TaxID=458836 RepID=UPI0038BD6765